MGIVRMPAGTVEKRSEFPGLKDVEDSLRSVVSGAEGIIKDMCMSLLNSGGKRLRPLMVIYSGLCFSGIGPELINTAVASELIHMASLVHDDIIDKSDSRRGRGTVNSLYGNHAAVLVGDYLFARAFSILSSYRLLKGMGYLVEAIEEMCDGEVNQAHDRFKTDVTVEEYFKRIGKKTGILISSCCRAGAASAGAVDREIGIMGEYGLNLGYAFQIVDDILDFTGNEKKLGKPTCMDLMNGNITLPVILLMEDVRYGKRVKNIIRSGGISGEGVGNIKELLERAGYIRKSYDIAEKCIAKAKSAIYSIPDSLYRSALLSMAEHVVTRDY